MVHSSAFVLLPDDLIRIIFSFSDIPTLGHIATTGNNVLARLACDDETWASLVEKRFRITTSKSRPVLHGGHSWKQAYFSMSHADRIPRGRYTGSQKPVFARGRANNRKSTKSTSPVSLWVLIGHTENCKTRTIEVAGETSTRDDANDNDTERNNDERCVELYLCMQNVKSGAGEVIVDVADSTLSLMGSTEGSDLVTARVGDLASLTSLRPRVLFHDAAAQSDLDLSGGIRLRPFDIAVVSVHFPCASDVFETDFLARAVSVQVPVRKPAKPSNKNATIAVQDVDARAFFIPEHDVWNYYMELPGNCLTLVDRFQMAVA